VAQRKRAGLITRRAMDRNHSQLLVFLRFQPSQQDSSIRHRLSFFDMPHAHHEKVTLPGCGVMSQITCAAQPVLRAWRNLTTCSQQYNQTSESNSSVVLTACMDHGLTHDQTIKCGLKVAGCGILEELRDFLSKRCRHCNNTHHQFSL
jgi:hypothetical protein